jgi:hypothetical protein
MMIKECTCKNGKKNPKCPACSKGDVNLDSFHKLNPEAKPKTAEQFKLSFAMSPGMTRAMQVGGAGLKGALPGALTGAALGFLSAPEGQGAAGAARGAAYGGLATGGAAALNHGMMTGTSGLAQDYQQVRGHEKAHKSTKARAQNVEYIRQRNTNAANAAAAAPAEAPKAAMYYEFGKRAAIADFDL